MSKLRITPVGTCRVHTPLRRASGRYSIEVDLRRNYGFVHTSDEALQLVRFLQGEKDFDPRVAPLVARDGDLDRFQREQWEPSDLHIVEISSSKRIFSGADAVQSNYLYRHFSNFFASSERSRKFWELVKKGNRSELFLYLREQPSFLKLSPADRELLRSLGIEQQSFKSIKASMAEIVERLGAERLLFVTHINAMAPDGARVPTRDRLIRWVKMAAGQLGAPVFDPTRLLEEVGQDSALENGGLDLTHYTPAFYDRVYDDMHRSHIGSLTDALAPVEGAGAREREVASEASRLEAMLDLGDFFGASRKVHMDVEASPDSLPLIELRGLIRSRIGDFRGAIADLTRRGDDTALSQEMRLGLLEALNVTGDAAGALTVAKNLLADEFESADIYRSAANAAERLGLLDDAIDYAKQAFRKDREDLPAALRALMLLTDHGLPADAEEWRRELLENIGESASGAFEISVWAVEHGDADLLARAIKGVAHLDKGAALDLLEDAFRSGLYSAVAASVPLAAALGRLPRPKAERRTALLQGLIETGTKLVEQCRFAEAQQIARALTGLESIESSQIPSRKLAALARRLEREMTRSIRLMIRDAHKRGDTAEVLRVGEAAGDTLTDYPDSAIIVARAMYSAGREEQALNLVKALQVDAQGDPIVARWTARIAALSGDYLTALPIYDSLRRSPQGQPANIRSEVDRFFATAERRALKQLRTLVADGRHEEAIALAAVVGELFGKGAVERDTRKMRRNLKKFVKLGEFREAQALATAFLTQFGTDAEIERELGRMYSHLRRRLKEADESDDTGEREATLRQMLSIRPDDPSTTRLLALDLTRQLRFVEAAEMWERLHRLDPTNEALARNRDRCLKMAQRRRSTWTGELEAAA